MLIFGGRSTALEIAETAEGRLGKDALLHVVGDSETGEEGTHWIQLKQLDSFWNSLPAEDRPGFIISMANHELRSACLQKMQQLGGQGQTLIHPDATVSCTAQLGQGVYVAAGARISRNASVGAHSILNFNCVLGHDTRTGSHLIVNPGASIGGHVEIGDRVLIGANAFIGQGLSIGSDCLIDAMTQVFRDIEPGQMVTGRSLRVSPRRGIR